MRITPRKTAVAVRVCRGLLMPRRPLTRRRRRWRVHAVSDVTEFDIPVDDDLPAVVEIESADQPVVVIRLPAPGKEPADPQRTTLVTPGDLIRVNGKTLHLVEEPAEVHFRAVSPNEH
jgi:hypothetical protein